MHEMVETRDSARVEQTIYGTNIIPRLEIKTATQKATISAGTICKIFIARPYRRAEIMSVPKGTSPSGCGLRRASYRRGKLGRRPPRVRKSSACGKCRPAGARLL